MATTGSEPSVFTRIIEREIPATIVAETDTMIAFEDINPKAPVHVVITPKTPQYKDVVELAAGAPELLAEMVDMAKGIADERSNGQFRLVFNNGEAAGQTVFHVHAHVLGGRLGEGSLAS